MSPAALEKIKNIFVHILLFITWVTNLYTKITYHHTVTNNNSYDEFLPYLQQNMTEKAVFEWF
jgi:hypothetical protein